MLAEVRARLAEGDRLLRAPPPPISEPPPPPARSDLSPTMRARMGIFDPRRRP